MKNLTGCLFQGLVSAKMNRVVSHAGGKVLALCKDDGNLNCTAVIYLIIANFTLYPTSECDCGLRLHFRIWKIGCFAQGLVMGFSHTDWYIILIQYS